MGAPRESPWEPLGEAPQTKTKKGRPGEPLGAPGSPWELLGDPGGRREPLEGLIRLHKSFIRKSLRRLLMAL